MDQWKETYHELGYHELKQQTSCFLLSPPALRALHTHLKMTPVGVRDGFLGENIAFISLLRNKSVPQQLTFAVGQRESAPYFQSYWDVDMGSSSILGAIRIFTSVSARAASPFAHKCIRYLYLRSGQSAATAPTGKGKCHLLKCPTTRRIPRNVTRVHQGNPTRNRTAQILNITGGARSKEEAVSASSAN